MAKRAPKLDSAALRMAGPATAPLHKRLRWGLVRAILAGQLGPGARLPSQRALARRMKVSRNTVSVAYDQLCAEGFLSARVGSGTRVAPAQPDTFLFALPFTGPRGRATLPGDGPGRRRLLRAASYPARAQEFTDASGNALYLFTATPSV